MHKSVLIADIAKVVTKKSESDSVITTLLTDFPEARFSEKWTWNYDQKELYYFNRSSAFKVAALIF